jgi:uncharacterized protein YbjT (DUF2867 family)
MSHVDRVLVTGATGTVGSHVVAGLADRDVAVRAAVRDPGAARGRFDEDVEAVAFDFERPETWGEAFEGVDAMFLVRPPAIGRVKRHLLPAVDAAVRVGVSHVVYLSVLGAERNPVLPHHTVEDHLRTVDASHTFLRASFFMQNLTEVHREEIAERGEVFVPAGDGATSFVDARDVAAVGVAALTEPGHGGRAYDVTGPEALTYHEVADVLSDVLGREVTYPRPGAVAFALRELRSGTDLAFAGVMLAIYTTARLGFAGRVTDDVEAVLDREPRTLRTFVADHADAFRTGEDATADPPTR